MPGPSLAKQGRSAGRRLDAEILALRRIVDHLSRHASGVDSCRDAAKLRACIWSARETLKRLESMVQDRHLDCCLIPDLRMPTDLAVGLARLKQHRRAAVVVCENRQRLDDYAARGLPLRSKLTPKVLEAIFAPNSRLRGGAAIVRGHDVIAAGVALPLAPEQTDANGAALDLDRRAALAVSRLTDALVFVVSDASGGIWVALEGQLRPLAAP